MIDPKTVTIPRKLATQLLHWAQINPEEEICGLISAKNGIPLHCYPIKNVATDIQRYFLLDTQEHIATMRTMRNQNESLFAIYHSHPQAPAIPSIHDLELEAYPDALYLIISLQVKGILELRGFKINQGSAQEIPLSISE